MSLIPDTQNYPIANDQYAGITKPASQAQLTAATKLDPNTGARLFVPCDLYNNGAGSGARTIIIPTGLQSGTLPQGATVFFGIMETRSAEVPLFIASAGDVISKIEMVSITGNGMGHSDVYTLVKNGTATAMTFTVTNAATGSTTANQQTLAAGDRISLQVATDAATAAADVLVQLTITR